MSNFKQQFSGEGLKQGSQSIGLGTSAITVIVTVGTLVLITLQESLIIVKALPPKTNSVLVSPLQSVYSINPLPVPPAEFSTPNITVTHSLQQS